MGNMFRCTLASGGGALILTVTCDSAFSGQTITCTDGVTTLTQTCPSASPYTVEFKIPNGGIWTVSSGTDSVSVTITDTATLHHIPTGSTETPTDVVQTWLHCANIWDKNYTTISQVLNNATIVTALIASTNAVDYMARSTTWASSVTANSSAMTKIGANNYCADKLLANSTWLNAICNSTYFESVLNVKVPTMTGESAPSGKVTASSTYTGYPAYQAFDSSDTSFWSSNPQSPTWIRYDFSNNQKVSPYKVKLVNRNFSDHIPKTFKIQGSNDGSTWTDLTSVITSTNQTAGGVSNYALSLLTTTKFNKIRMYTMSTVGNNTDIAKLQFYCRE